MTTDHHQAADRNPVSLKRLLIGTAALPVAALGLMMSFGSEAEAFPIAYEIPLASVSYTTGAGGVGSVSGSFTYDPSGGTYSNVDIHLTDTAAATDGPFTVILPPSSSHKVLFASNGTSPTADVELQFANSLSTVADPLVGVYFQTNATNAGQFENVKATAYPQVPEPSSIAILGAALGLLRLRRRGSRKR